MGTIADKMKYLLNTKKLIRKSIISKGIDVGEEDTFRSYADKINLLNESYGGKYNISQKINDDDTCDLIISNSLSGSEGVGTGKYVCRVIDYDGTILKEQYLDTGDVFVLPEIPTHEGLIAQGYSSPVEIIDYQVVVDNSDLIFGIIYTTESGLSEFDIELTKVTGLDVTLDMDRTKDWGDGTSNTETTHTYSSYGNYTIKCNGTTMTNVSSFGLFGQRMAEPNYYCKNVRFGNSVTSVGDYAFYYCYSLLSITMSSHIKSVGERAFGMCLALTSITIPNSITTLNRFIAISTRSLTNLVIPNSVISMNDGICYECYSLTNIKIPNSVKSMGNMIFYDCYSLRDLIIPNSVEYLHSTFRYCSSLTNIKIPNSVKEINDQTFYGCSSIVRYDFSQHTTIPTLANTGAFYYINATAKIIVPDNLYDNWILATNWSSYADYIYKASEVL